MLELVLSQLPSNSVNALSQIENLFDLLPQARGADVWRLKKRLIQLKKNTLRQADTLISDEKSASKLTKAIQSTKQLKVAIEKSIQVKQTKLAAIPEIVYPEGLPISDCAEEIRQAIETHQVVIIAGETGSGKTTQIPQRGPKGAKTASEHESL